MLKTASIAATTKTRLKYPNNKRTDSRIFLDALESEPKDFLTIFVDRLQQGFYQVQQKQHNKGKTMLTRTRNKETIIIEDEIVMIEDETSVERTTIKKSKKSNNKTTARPKVRTKGSHSRKNWY